MAGPSPALPDVKALSAAEAVPLSKTNKAIFAVIVFLILVFVVGVVFRPVTDNPWFYVGLMKNRDTADRGETALVAMDVRAVNAIIASDLDTPTKVRLLNAMSPVARARAVKTINRLAELGELRDDHPHLQPLFLVAPKTGLTLDADIVLHLIDGAMDPDINVRKTYLGVIVRRVRGPNLPTEELAQYTKDERLPTALKQLLRDPDPSLQLCAARLLGALGLARAGDLSALLDTEDQEVRCCAAKLLAQLGATEQADRMMKIALSADPKTRQAMMLAVYRLVGAKGKRVFEKNLFSRADDTRCAAAYFLSVVGDDNSIELLERLARQQNGKSEAAAAGALIRLGRKEYYARLSTLLKHSSPLMRRAAVAACHLAAGDGLPDTSNYSPSRLKAEVAKWQTFCRARAGAATSKPASKRKAAASRPPRSRPK